MARSSLPCTNELTKKEGRRLQIERGISVPRDRDPPRCSQRQIFEQEKERKGVGMKKRLRSPAILLTVFAMVLVVAGVAYAHWTSTSRIEANVNVGNMQIGWTAWGTNDDGDLGNDPSGYDNPASMGEWNPPWNETSLDPADPWDLTDRHNKNVASCFIEGGEDTLNVSIDGAYPSYYCNIYAQAFNHGSVPGMATHLRLTAEKAGECTLHENADFSGINLYEYMNEDPGGQFVDLDTNGDFDGADFYVYQDEWGNWFKTAGDVPLYQNCVTYTITPVPTGIEGEFMFSDDLTLNIDPGIYCGTQIDPGPWDESTGEPLDGIPVGGWIHIENGMEQGANYQISLEQDWINWNEWDPSMCTFNGVPLP